MTLATKRVTRRQQKRAARMIRWWARDLQAKLAMELAMEQAAAAAAAAAMESDSEFEDSEEELELQQPRRPDRRPLDGNKINKPQRGGRVDPLCDYEALTPSWRVASEPGSSSRARAHCRATGNDGAWWPALFVQ